MRIEVTSAEYDRIIAALSLMRDIDEADQPEEAQLTRDLIAKIEQQEAKQCE
jgi:hypothetical protein